MGSPGFESPATQTKRGVCDRGPLEVEAGGPGGQPGLPETLSQTNKSQYTDDLKVIAQCA